MYDQKLLEEKYGFSIDTYECDYYKEKVALIRKHNLEAVKMTYEGYTISDIYSFNGDCKFDCVILSKDGCPQVCVNHYKKIVKPIHGYKGKGKELAKKLGYKYEDI